MTYSFSIASRRVTIFVSMSEPFNPRQATKCPINLKNPSNPFDPLRTNPSATLSWLHPNALFILGFRISSQSLSGDPALFAHSAGSSENMANGCSGPASAISFGINSSFSRSFCKISIACRQPRGSSDNNVVIVGQWCCGVFILCCLWRQETWARHQNWFNRVCMDQSRGPDPRNVLF